MMRPRREPVRCPLESEEDVDAQVIQPEVGSAASRLRLRLRCRGAILVSACCIAFCPSREARIVGRRPAQGPAGSRCHVDCIEVWE